MLVIFAPLVMRVAFELVSSVEGHGGQLVGPRRTLRSTAPAEERARIMLEATRRRHKELSLRVKELDVNGFHSLIPETQRLKKKRLREKDRMASLIACLRRLQRVPHVAGNRLDVRR